MSLLKQRCNENEEELFKLRTENNRLEALIKTLRRELEESRALHSKAKVVTNNDESKVNELKLDLIQTKQELNRAKEALQGEYSCSVSFFVASFFVFTNFALFERGGGKENQQFFNSAIQVVRGWA